MTGAPITLCVLTAAGLAFEDQAISVVAPGELGYLGVLRNHAPLVTTLKSGKLSWKRPDGSERAVQVGEGLFEIAHNRCTLLTTDIKETAA